MCIGSFFVFVVLSKYTNFTFVTYPRVVGAIEGHCGLNGHLNKLTLSDIFRYSCDFKEGTGVHLTCDRPKFIQLRHRSLGDYEVAPSKAAALEPNSFERLLAAT